MGFLVSSDGKASAYMQETWVRFLGGEDLLTHIKLEVLVLASEIVLISIG